MDEREKIFKLSVTSLEDSVIQTGSVETLKTKYFGHYARAIKYLEEQCREFIEEENLRYNRIKKL